MNKTNSEKRALNVSEAAEYACVSRATLAGWIDRGILKHERLPGRGAGHHRFILIRKTDLDAFLDRSVHSPQKKVEANNSRGEIILLENCS